MKVNEIAASAKSFIMSLANRIDKVQVDIITTYLDYSYEIDDLSEKNVDMFLAELYKIDLHFDLVIKYDILHDGQVIDKGKRYIYRRSFTDSIRYDYDDRTINYDNNIALIERVCGLLDEDKEVEVLLNYAKSSKSYKFSKSYLHLCSFNIQEILDTLLAEEVPKGMNTVMVREVIKKARYAREVRDIYLFK